MGDLQEEEMSGDNPTGSWENRRKFKRRYMLFKIPAYDAKTRRFLGLVQDITEGGIQLFGVQVDAGSTMTIIIQASDYIKSSPLHFDAVCRWTTRENPHGYFVSGFEIVTISEEAKKNLAKLMEFVALG
jgi:hypothetical protein